MLPNPPKPPPIDQTVGNHVTVRIGAGLYVLYAHFDPGSVQVHIGEKVSRGQLLGLIGTSGNSTTPHLHFQIMTTFGVFPHRQRALCLRSVPAARPGARQDLG